VEAEPRRVEKQGEGMTAFVCYILHEIVQPLYWLAASEWVATQFTWRLLIACLMVAAVHLAAAAIALLVIGLAALVGVGP
jgi:hypothetical protein